MSDLWDSLNAMPMEPYGGAPTQIFDTAILPRSGPSGTALLPKVGASPTRGRRLIEGTKAVGRGARRSIAGGFIGALGATLGAGGAISGSVAPHGIKGVGYYAPELASDLLQFAATRGGVIGAAAGASMGLLNPALRSVATGTAAGVASGARRVGRRVSRTLGRAPGSRSSSINNVLNGDGFPQIAQQVDDDVQASIAELVRQTISKSPIPDSGPITPESFRRILGLPNAESPEMTALRNMPISSPSGPITVPMSMPGTTTAVTSATIPTGATASVTSPAMSSTAGATGSISTTPRTPAAVIPTSSTPRVASGKMSKNTKYALFAGGLLATSVVMGSRNKKENQINQSSQYKQTPYPNSVRNQYMPASV